MEAQLKRIEALEQAVKDINKEVKSLRGMVFLSMKKRKTNNA